MTKLGDVCTIVSGTTPKTSVSEYWDGDINWITPAELNEDTVVINESKRKITKAGVISCGLSPFPAGTVILSSRAPIGKTAIAGTEMYCNQGFKNLICSDKIHNKYLFWFLRSKTEMLNSLGRGATFKEISKSIVENIEIPLPDLPTQQRIADTLDKVSEGIEVCRRMLGELDLMVKAKFQEMFGDPITNTYSLPMISLSEIGNWSSGGTPSRSMPDYFGGNIDWYSAGELNTLYLESSIEKITQDALENSAAKLFPAGSMLVGMYDTAAFKMGILKRNSASNQACACIEPNDSIDVVWLYHVLQIMKPHFLEQRRGIRQKNLNLGMIKSFQIPYAPKSEQKLFTSFVTKIDKSKLTIQGIRDKMEMEKLALMQGYFG